MSSDSLARSTFGRRVGLSKPDAGKFERARRKIVMAKRYCYIMSVTSGAWPLKGPSNRMITW